MYRILFYPEKGRRMIQHQVQVASGITETFNHPQQSDMHPAPADQSVNAGRNPISRRLSFVRPLA